MSTVLQDGSRVGVVGGGPAGSFFAYFLLDMASRVGTDLKVDVYEFRDFSTPGPGACNMCGGIISETLVQNLAAEGINLPATVVQRGIDSYVLHTDLGSVKLETPMNEKRIAAVHRGPGPRDVKEAKWGSFDGHLLSLAKEKGARVVRGRVDQISRDYGRYQLTTKDGAQESYDLIAVAAGVNTATLKLFESLGTGYRSPGTTQTSIREYYLGGETIASCMGSSMHVFLLDLPRLEFAAIIPKGDYATVCLLGDGIDSDLLRSFLTTPEVRGCFPPDWQWDKPSCNCSPRINVKGAQAPYADGLVFLGDTATTRLYKDGIGAAYRMAKAAASTAVFEGISKQAFEAHYWPVCRRIGRDNSLGRVIFAATGLVRRFRFARRAIMSMTAAEQRRTGDRVMSTILWDMFTGSAPYAEVFTLALNPVFGMRMAGHLVRSILPRDTRVY